MKKITALVVLLFLSAVFQVLSAQPNEEATMSLSEEKSYKEIGDTTSAKGVAKTLNIQTSVATNYVRVGAVESIKGDAFELKQRNASLEFIVNETTKIYLTDLVTESSVEEGKYLLVRGPHNRKVALANSVNIYSDRKNYTDVFSKEEPALKDDATLLKGYVKSKDPIVIATDEKKEYRIEPDEDTYWILNATASKSDIKAGDRLFLYFDKVVTQRYQNIPVKIVIKRSLSGQQ